MAKVALNDGTKERKIKMVKKKAKKPIQEEVESAEEEIVEDDLPEVDASDEEVPGNLDESENSDEESEEEDEGEKLAERFRENMSNLPLSQVRAMKDKLGIKLFNKAYFGDKKEPTKAASTSKETIPVKRGQHRPKEVSSKKRVPAFRNIYPEEKKTQRWDPRFDERAGTYKEVCFEDNYKFLDEIRTAEKEQLRQNIQSCMETGSLEGVKYASQLKRLETQERAQKEKRLKKATMQELQQENIDRLMQGQKPIFKTKAEVRKKVMEKKFEQLKEENRLSKYLQKREKKQSEKELRKKPAFEEKYGYH